MRHSSQIIVALFLVIAGGCTAQRETAMLDRTGLPIYCYAIGTPQQAEVRFWPKSQPDRLTLTLPQEPTVELVFYCDTFTRCGTIRIQGDRCRVLTPSAATQPTNGDPGDYWRYAHTHPLPPDGTIPLADWLSR